MRVLIISGSMARLPDPVYPLGAAIVGTAVRRAGYELHWFDALRHDDPETTLEQVLRRLNPEAVLLSIRNIDNTSFPGVFRHFQEHKTLTQVIRRCWKGPLVLGGSGFSLMPEAFLAYTGADHGIVGEGEETAPSLLRSLKEGKAVSTLIYAPAVTPPFLSPDRDLFDASWYYQSGGAANVQTQRGCSHKCVYCTYPLLEGRDARRNDPADVVEEMVQLKHQGIDHFFIVDALFNRSETHVMDLCNEILRRNLRISFTGYVSPTGEHPDLPALLKRAGCSELELGTDSLSDPVLDGLHKGFTAEDAMVFSRRLKNAGILQCHSLIFGGPGETAATMEESVRRIDEIDPTAVIATIGLRVYPGTPLAAIDAGRLKTSSPADLLEPTFYLSPEVETKVVEVVQGWSADRPNWICPGLEMNYSARNLARIRRRNKGVLWRMIGKRQTPSGGAAH